MKDKWDKLLLRLFHIKKTSIKIPEIPDKIIPEFRSGQRLGFSISFVVIIAFCFVSFILFTFIINDYEVPFSTVYSNFIEKFKLGEKIIEGISYLQDSFIGNQL
ncbi:MAG: hypothetical protein JXB88_05125 [Spirochaetales bacterium]|nr:hypothetical protein [Spirochaetales bacterium]